MLTHISVQSSCQKYCSHCLFIQRYWLRPWSDELFDRFVKFLSSSEHNMGIVCKKNRSKVIYL